MNAVVVVPGMEHPHGCIAVGAYCICPPVSTIPVLVHAPVPIGTVHGDHISRMEHRWGMRCGRSDDRPYGLVAAARTGRWLR